MKISPSTTPYETRFSEKRGSHALLGRHGEKKTNSHPLGDRLFDEKSTSKGSRTLENGVKTASLASCSSDDDVVKRLLSTHRRLSNFWTIYMKISGVRPLLDKKALHKNGDFHNYKT